jgi:hypothetical protein
MLMSLLGSYGLIKMQAIAMDLVKIFESALAEAKPEIIRIPARGIMSPMINGKEHERVQ